MRKNYYKDFPIDFLRRGVRVIVGDDEYIQSVLSDDKEPKETLKVFDELWKGAKALSIHNNDDGSGYILLRELPEDSADVGTLLHEVIHSVNFMLRYLDIKVTMKNDELLCYMCENLCSRILNWSWDLIRQLDGEKPARDEVETVSGKEVES